MHPRDGLQLDEEAAHYMPENRLQNWEEYDEKVTVKLYLNEQISKPRHYRTNLSILVSRNTPKISRKSQLFLFWNLLCLCTPSTSELNTITLSSRYILNIFFCIYELIEFKKMLYVDLVFHIGY